MEKALIDLRIDDIALLYAEIQSLKIGEKIDEHLIRHGNWEGVSAGRVVELWLCYMLSEGDHRLSVVEEWAESRIELLRALSDSEELSSYDFSDDKLGLVLEYIGIESIWNLIEVTINSGLLGVYRLEEQTSLATFRLDAAPIQSYGKVKEGGLLQYGYHKHHANLGQMKVKLCTLDNDLNHFASPICHITVPGNVSDDELYVPILKQTRESLKDIAGYEKGNLYIGDSKFGSMDSRSHVVLGSDYYMMPLSLVQLKDSIRKEEINSVLPSEYQQVYKTVEKGGKKEQILVAEGFEKVKSMENTLFGKTYNWEERRVYVRSVNYVKSKEQSLDARLEKASLKIQELPIRKQGKQVLKTRAEYEERIVNCLLYTSPSPRDKRQSRMPSSA